MRISLADLLKNGGLVKEKNIGWDQIERFLVRARKDLATSKKVLSLDEAVSLDLVYKAMFHAANAF